MHKWQAGKQVLIPQLPHRNKNNFHLIIVNKKKTAGNSIDVNFNQAEF